MDFDAQFIIRENILIVRLTGELAHHEAKFLRKEWQEHLGENDVKDVVLNLANLTFMDSSGIGVILGRYKEIMRGGGELVVCSVHPQIERILLMSGLFKLIRKEEDEQYALLSLGVAS